MSKLIQKHDKQLDKKLNAKQINIFNCENNYKNINQTISKLQKYYNIEEKKCNNYCKSISNKNIDKTQIKYKHNVKKQTEQMLNAIIEKYKNICKNDEVNINAEEKHKTEINNNIDSHYKDLNKEIKFNFTEKNNNLFLLKDK